MPNSIGSSSRWYDHPSELSGLDHSCGLKGHDRLSIVAQLGENCFAVLSQRRRSRHEIDEGVADSLIGDPITLIGPMVE